MSEMNNFQDFIFHSDLHNELKLFVDKPNKIPNILCFYGSPGTGKTSFAKYFAETYAKDNIYLDMNTVKTNGSSFGDLLSLVTRYFSTYSLFDNETAVYEKCIIFDEWHNATMNQQDAFKIPFETFSRRKHCLFILCLNTDRKNPLSSQVSQAIISRSHCISFDSNISHLEELKKLAKAKYPLLTDNQIITHLPDFRAIQRLADLAA